MAETTESVSQDQQGPLVDNAIGAFMKRWEETPQEQSAPAEEAQAEAVDEQEVSEEQTVEAEELEVIEEEEIDLDAIGEDGELLEEAAAEYVADDYVTKVKVGDEEIEVSVSDLKRLYGQEKSLTQKSQQVADMRKTLEDETQKNAAILQTLLAKAEERLKPYAEIDMLLASKQMGDDEFAQLRKEAQTAYDDYQFLNQETGTYLEMIQVQQAQELKTRAAQAMEKLTQDIPEWSESLYNKIRDYGVSQGISQNDIDQLVDPAAIKLVHKAMKYDAAKKVAAKKRAAAPKKVLKPGVTNPQSNQQRARNKAMESLATSGTVDAAQDAFLAKWSAN